MIDTSKLKFSIHFENNKSFILELSASDVITNGRKNQAIYYDHIKKLASGKEEEILKKLLLIHRKNHPFESLDTLRFNRLELSLIKHFSLLKTLVSTYKITWNNQPLVYRLPGIRPKLFFAIQERVDASASVQVFFYLNGKKLELEKIFIDAGFFIAEHFIYEMDGPKKIDTYLSKYLEKTIISKIKKEDLIDELVLENISYELQKAKAVNKTPLLFLLDPRGLFSKIGISYDQQLEVFLDDPISHPLRDDFFEKSLKEDLLELGFTKKTEGYYLPLDEMESALRFILEMGWKVFDFQRREVLIDKKIQLKMELCKDEFENEERVEVFSYVEDQEIDLMALSRSCFENQLFCPLSTTTVSLIDPMLKEKIKPLLKGCSWKGDRMVLSREQIGYAFDQKSSALIKKGEELEAFLAEKESIQKPGASFCGKLMPYQEKGLSWLLFLYKRGFSALLADEMGLGKTVQVLAFLSAIESKGPCLICVPAALVYNWKKEIERFLQKGDLWIHHGPDRLKDPEVLTLKKIVIVSYQTLRLDQDLFRKISFHVIVLDEAMMIKNSLSKIALAACQLKAYFRLCITATPLENHLGELFSLFTFLLPERSKAWKLEPLLISEEIKPYLLRRLKKDVELQLPDRIVQDVWVEMTEEQKHTYQQFIGGKKDLLQEKTTLEILTFILRLRQIAAHPSLAIDTCDDSIKHSAKLLLLFEELEEVFSEKHKVIVYSQFTQLLQIVKSELEKRGYTYVYLDGKVALKEREKRIAFFQETEENIVFLISLKAGGVGLNLTAADYVYLLDPWWNDKVEDQAIDRAHRIGQKRAVIAKKLYAKDSIEEKIQLLKQEKSFLFEQVIEGKNPTHLLEKEDLLRLLD